MHRRTLGLLSLIALIGGCVVDNDDSVVIADDTPSAADIFEAQISTGVLLDALPGEGAGAFIEYHGDGRWHVFVSCDTTDPSTACQWDVWAQGADPITSFESDGLEPDDAVYGTSSGAVVLQTHTDNTLDGFFFETTPGQTVRIGVWLDGVADPRFLFWAGEDVVHRGAPSDPLDLVPTEP